MNEAVAVPPPVSHRDRRGGLIAFGVLHLLLGAFCALMVPMMMIALVAAAVTDGSLGASVSPRMMLPALFFYVALAFWFITMGVGSIRCRRWARALILVCSWIWLVSGVSGLGFMLWFYAPQGGLPNASAPGVPSVITTVVGIVTLVIMAVLYVVVPGLFVLFYGRANVRATCERRDPRERWTDRCPLPVLGVSVMAAFWGGFLPFMGVYHWTVPAFGTLLQGPAGAAVLLLALAVLAGVAWGAYRLRPAAWWTAVALVVAWTVSANLTFARVGLMAMYERMGLPPQQMTIMRQAMAGREAAMVVMMTLWGAVALGYLLYVRRFFRRGSPGTAGFVGATVAPEPDQDR